MIVMIVVMFCTVHALRHYHLKSGGHRAVLGVSPMIGLVGWKPAEPIKEFQTAFRNVHSLHCHVSGGHQEDFAEKVRRGILNCDIETERIIDNVAFNQELRYVGRTVEACNDVHC